MPEILQNMVLDFHEQMGQSIGDPRCPDTHVDRELRLKILKSELQELYDALEADDTIEVADALGDIVYVLQGAAISWGIDLASVIEEIHRSNMTKTKECTDAINAAKLDGSYVPGKLPKGPNFSPASINRVLEDAGANFDAGPDGWWRKPTMLQVKLKSYEEIYKTLKAEAMGEEPPPVSRELKVAAVAKTIPKSANFVDCECPHQDANEPDHDKPCPAFGKNQMPPEMSEKILKETEPKPYNWQLTKWGGLVFDCTCGRTHSLPSSAGSRGGIASVGKCECMCGKAYVVHFHKLQDPQIQETTIEELRKVQA